MAYCEGCRRDDRKGDSDSERAAGCTSQCIALYNGRYRQSGDEIIPIRLNRYSTMTYLSNIHVAGREGLYHLKISEGKILGVADGKPQPAKGDHTLEFEDAIAFPGLINSHDHLDFNLFPALGDMTYNSYTEWGRHIHKNYKNKINEVLKVPEILREQWGVYKNLLCGVTTVINHGKQINNPSDIITIYQNCQSIHSVQFEKKW